MADVTLRTNGTSEFGAGFRPMFWTSDLIGYAIFKNGSEDLVYKKTTDGGASWGSDVTIRLDSALRKFDCWADWDTTDDFGSEIHIAWIGSSAVGYRSLDTASDTLSTEVTIQSVSGTDSTSNYTSSIISICKARGGDLGCAFYNEDAGTDTSGFEVSSNGGATWVPKDAGVWEGEAERLILHPSNASNTNDFLGLSWDHSASEVDRKLFDSTGNSWSTTLITGGAIISFTGRTHGWGACFRKSDNHSILIFQNAGDTAGTDLECWDVASDSITAKTDVWSNENDHIGVTIAIDQNTDNLYAVFGGDTAETVGSAINIYRSLSDDGGGSWVTKVQINEGSADNFQEVWVDTSVGGVKAGLIAVAWINVTPAPDEVLFSAVNAIVIEGGAPPIAFDTVYHRAPFIPFARISIPTLMDGFIDFPGRDAPPPDGALIAKLIAGGVI